jgi:uncharacterized protein
MRIDVHTHIFPSDIVSARERFFEGEPVFRLLYDSPKARLSTAEGLLEIMDRDGVDHAVAFGFPWLQQDLAVRHNDYVLEAAARSGSRLIPFGCVNPLASWAGREAERSLANGSKGLGELAVYESCDPRQALDAYSEVIGCCRSHGAVLLVHANETVGHMYPGKAPFSLDFYYELVRLAAGVPLILAHWGGGLCFYELLKREAPKVLAQVYYDTAASPFVYQPSIYSVMSRALPAGKVLFGSDYPLLPPSRYWKEMEEAGLTVEERIAIGGANAALLFGMV